MLSIHSEHRDWVTFELGIAKGSKIDIFVWIDKKVAVDLAFIERLPKVAGKKTILFCTVRSLEKAARSKSWIKN